MVNCSVFTYLEEDSGFIMYLPVRPKDEEDDHFTGYEGCSYSHVDYFENGKLFLVKTIYEDGSVSIENIDPFEAKEAFAFE